MIYFYVGMGGVLGALTRFYLGSTIQQVTGIGFPYSTLSVNLLGSFLLSFIAYSSSFRWKLPDKYLIAINTGCIGSFTTFSTFSVETIKLIEGSQFMAALGYVIFSVTGGLALAWLGIKVARRLYQAKTTVAGGGN